MSQAGGQEHSSGLTPWDPARYLQKRDSGEVRLSRGFLRSKPEKWFPGFASQWMPLAHSMGVEIKPSSIEPIMGGAAVPQGSFVAGFAGTVDDEPLTVFVDSDSSRSLLQAFSPGITDKAGDVLLEYLARRLLASLAGSWSGPESSVVRFDSDINPRSVQVAGGVKLGFQVNTSSCTVWILCGKLLIERLDGLWRRQVRSSMRLAEQPSELSIELVQLAVPPSMLVDYISPGADVDLEIPVTDLVTLRLNGKPWLPGRLCDVDGRFGFQVLGGPVTTPSLPEGTTRLSIQFGSIQVEPSLIAELSQPGAIFATDISVGNSVSMVINNERVGSGGLCIYEGRFAITVN